MKPAEKRHEQMAQKSSSKALQLLEVHPGGTEDRIDPVAFVSVSAIPHVNKDMLRCTGNPFNLREGFCQRVTVIGVAMDGLGADEPTTPACCRYADLAAELVTLVCFPLANAFHQWLMNTVDFLLVEGLPGKDSLCRFQE